MLREVWHGRVWKARPWTVVEDTPERLVLWIQRGARTNIPLAKLPLATWELREDPFPANALRVTKPGAAHSILHFFDDPGTFAHWYVNLEKPLVRFAHGFDVPDLFLDVVIHPNGRWHWDDEDELEAALGAGLLTEEEARGAREEGERVLAEWPFPTGWEDFRPDPRWELPMLPDGWNVV